MLSRKARMRAACRTLRVVGRGSVPTCVDVRRLRLSAAVLLVVAIAVGAAAFAIGDVPSACEVEQQSSRAAPRWARHGSTVTAVIGDSWSVGFGLDDPARAFPYLLAERMGWSTRVAGYSGSGYVTAGACGTDYMQRADGVPAAPELVLLEGGVDDQAVMRDLQGIEQAVRDAIAAARSAAAPGRGSWSSGCLRSRSCRRRAFEQVNSLLEQGARARGAIWIDASSWVIAMQDDGVHPTARGHSELARRITAALH